MPAPPAWIEPRATARSAGGTRPRPDTALRQKNRELMPRTLWFKHCRLLMLVTHCEVLRKGNHSRPAQVWQQSLACVRCHSCSMHHRKHTCSPQTRACITRCVKQRHNRAMRDMPALAVLLRLCPRFVMSGTVAFQWCIVPAQFQQRQHCTNTCRSSLGRDKASSRDCNVRTSRCPPMQLHRFLCGHHNSLPSPTNPTPNQHLNSTRRSRGSA